MKSNKKISILIPDGESHVLTYVINCFVKSGGVDLYVMSDNKNYYMRFSRHIKKFLYHTKKEKKRGWVKLIDENVDKYNIDVVFPIFEKAIKALIKQKINLKSKDRLCALPSLIDFDNACNKEFLYNHLQKSVLSYPKSIIAKPNKVPNLNNLQYPIIAKPVEGSGGGVGIKVLKNRNETLNYCKHNSFQCNIIFQEYINGYDVCSNVLCKNGEILAYTMQKGIAFENGEETYQVAFKFIENTELYKQTLALTKSLSWTGVANIDWRYDVDAKEFKVIEINPRYWYNTDASAMVGVNFPYLSCLSHLRKELEYTKPNLITFYNLKGLVAMLKTNPLTIFKVNFLRNQTPLFLVLSDPIPLFHKFLWRTKNVIFRGSL